MVLVNCVMEKKQRYFYLIIELFKISPVLITEFCLPISRFLLNSMVRNAEGHEFLDFRAMIEIWLVSDIIKLMHQL